MSQTLLWSISGEQPGAHCYAVPGGGWGGSVGALFGGKGGGDAGHKDTTTYTSCGTWYDGSYVLGGILTAPCVAAAAGSAGVAATELSHGEVGARTSISGARRGVLESRTLR